MAALQGDAAQRPDGLRQPGDGFLHPQPAQHAAHVHDERGPGADHRHLPVHQRLLGLRRELHGRAPGGAAVADAADRQRPGTTSANPYDVLAASLAVKAVNGGTAATPATTKVTIKDACGVAYTDRATYTYSGATYLQDPVVPYGTALTVCARSTVAPFGWERNDGRQHDRLAVDPGAHHARRLQEPEHDAVPVIARLLRDERGFTLVELLAASVVGVIVVGAAFGLLDATVRGRATTEDRVDAVARGRIGMEAITRDLRAALCLNDGQPAVRTATASAVTFVASIGAADPGNVTAATSNATPTTFDPPVQRRTLTFVDGGGGIGSIREDSVANTGSLTAPVFTGAATSRILVERHQPGRDDPVLRLPRAEHRGHGVRRPARAGDRRRPVADRRGRRGLPRPAAPVDVEGRRLRVDEGERPAAHRRPHRRRSEAGMLTRLSRRARREEGFTMIVMMGVLLVIMILSAGAFAAIDGDGKPALDDRQGKQAFSAAEAGIADYLSRLRVNPNYWTLCATDTANNASINNVNPATRRWATIPGGSAQYSVEVLPANGASTCSTANPQGTIVDVTSSAFRVRSTGRSVAGGKRRSLVATFRPAGFLDYIYFTDKETGDPAMYRLALTQSNGSGGKAWKLTMGNDGRSVEQWGYDECSTRYWQDGRGTQQFNGTNANRGRQRISDNGWDSLTYGCQTIQFADQDRIQGPFHTNDSILTCGSPDFGEIRSDQIEIARGPAPGWRTCGSGAPNFVGTYVYPAGHLQLPVSNGSLVNNALAANRFRGRTTIVLNGDDDDRHRQAARTAPCSRAPRQAIPADGVVYINEETIRPCRAAPPTTRSTRRPPPSAAATCASRARTSRT